MKVMRIQGKGSTLIQKETNLRGHLCHPDHVHLVQALQAQAQILALGTKIRFFKLTMFYNVLS